MCETFLRRPLSLSLYTPIYMRGTAQLNMETGILGLPVEIRYEVLDSLSLAEWRKMRLVSRQWNELCQTLVWRKVAVGPSRDVMLTFQDYKMFRDFDPDIWDVEYDPREAYLVLSYQRLRELASNWQFQKALRENTRELYIHYNHLAVLSDEDGELACELMARLFGSLSKIKLSYTPGPYNHSFPEFQKMIDKWKSTADFCLELVTSDGAQECIYVDGMRIKELFLRKPYRIEEDPLLPLSKTRQNMPIRYAELPSLCKDLVTLSLEIDRSMFRSHWIPDSTKYLHLRNNPGQYSSSAQLVVPSGVEYLYITDLFEFGWGVDDTMVSVLDCVDLSAATGLKVMSYKGPNVSKQLAGAILRVKKTLEHLTVLCLSVPPQSTDAFMALIHGDLGVKQLRLSITLEFPGDEAIYQFPELSLLQLDYYEIGFPREARTELQCLEILVTGFLCGCPKLAAIQLQSADKLPWAESKAWILPCPGRQHMLYNIDICKFRAIFDIIPEGTEMSSQ